MPSSATKNAPRRRRPQSVTLAIGIALIAPAAALVLIAGLAMNRYLQPEPTPTLIPSLAPAVAAATAAPAVPTADTAVSAAPSPTATASGPATAPTLPPPEVSPLPASATPTTGVPNPATSATPPPAASPTPEASPESSLTPTVTATSTPSQSPTATNTSTGPTPTPSLTPPATPQPGWAFVNVRLLPDTASSLLYVYGELVNNTGAAQQILNISGSFYDEQGRLVAGPLDTLDRVPTDVLPPGGRLPFELLALGPMSAANYALSVQARSSALAVRDNFTFSDTGVVSQRGQTCLAGTLAPPEPAVADYLTIAVAWVDETGRVVALSDPYEPSLEDLAGPHSFSVCTDLRGVSASGFLLRAWGN